MALFVYGPEHDWFAWHPVWTPVGYKWLIRMRRYRVHLGPSMPGAASWWSYKTKDRHES